MHRTVDRADGVYALREPGEAYARDFGGESEPLRLENTFPWEENAEAADIVWSDPGKKALRLLQSAQNSRATSRVIGRTEKSIRFYNMLLLTYRRYGKMKPFQTRLIVEVGLAASLLSSSEWSSPHPDIITLPLTPDIITLLQQSGN
jgi:hypothetical protein